MKVEFTVLGEPKGKGRPRFTTKNGYARAYTPSATTEYEQLIQFAYKSQCRGVMFDDNIPLSLHIKSYHKIPKNTSKKQKALMLSGDIRPTKTPDADNIIKIICDALNGVAYYDDKQVVEVSIHKFYSDEPRADVEIFEIEE